MIRAGVTKEGVAMPGLKDGIDANLAYRRRQIDPAVLGRRIRAARDAARLTQAEVAGPQTSTAYISRIEAGQRRPSGRMLEQIAERVNVTVEQLLFESADESRTELRFNLSRAEWYAANGKADQAHALASEVAVQAAALGMMELSTQACVVQARCLLAAGASSDAVELLQLVLDAPNQLTVSAQAQVELGRAYLQLGMPRRALRVVVIALADLEEYQLEGLPESLELSLLEATARSQLGQTAAAITACSRALDQAASISRESGIEGAHWRASETHAEQGVFESAWRHAERAVALRALASYGDTLGLLRQKLDQLSASPLR